MNKVKLALIGAGLRGVNYTNVAIDHPEEVEIVAVAEPWDERRDHFQQVHQLQDEMCFTDWRDMLSQPKLADAVLICTQDHMHFEPTMKALDAGYHVLLEKPMSPDPVQCIQMGEKANKRGLVFSICHVLRYTRFFGMIKQMLDEGKIGRLMSIQHNENVGYWHQAHSFVRGNWRSEKESSPMILAKSCHDMDILLWLAGASCKRVSSFGSLSHFRSEHAPAGATKRCLDGCPAADTCLYYAPKTYLTDEPNWMQLAISNDQSVEARTKAIEEGPYGRCVYYCDNDVVDHQVVNMEFENEVTAVFTMSAFTQECSRTIKLMGTLGEIRGAMEKNEVEWIPFGAEESERMELGTPGGHAGHGGGDEGLVWDFIKLVRANGLEKGLTSADISVQSHLMAFAAEHARLAGEVVELASYAEQFRSSAQS